MRKHLITPQDDQKATGQRAHLDAILSEFPASRGRQHCIEGMLIMMMMNCPVADVALMILPGGRETSHHQDSWHIPPIEGCLHSVKAY